MIVALVSAARKYGLDSAWAVERASQLGYPFDKEPGQSVVKLFKAVLLRQDEARQRSKRHSDKYLRRIRRQKFGAGQNRVYIDHNDTSNSNSFN